VPELINANLVALDAQLGDGKEAVITSLAQIVADAGRSTNPTGLAADAFAREAKSATGMPGGLAIPHCRSDHVSEPTLAFARLAPPVDFGAKDSPADLVFMIAAPTSGDQVHMKLLTKLARALVRPEFTSALRAATTKDEVVALVSEVVAPDPVPAEGTAPAAATTAAATPAAAAPQHAAPAPEDESAHGRAAAGMTIVAVTACPTGIAHTYMAAEALAAAGKKAGVNVVVEPQGSVGAETIDPAAIASASAVIFATDVGVRNRERFEGLPEIVTGVKQGIHDADQLVAQAIAAANDPSAARVTAAAGGGSGADSRPTLSTPGFGGLGTKLRTALLTGVSYMIPFVAAGGLLIALGFLLGGYEIALGSKTVGVNLGDYVLNNYKLTDLPPGSLSPHALFDSGFLLYIGACLFKIGGLAFAFLIPALAGYIAFAIADRPGIAPGFIAGSVAVYSGAGFIGGIVGGLLAGVVALWFARRPVPAFVRGLMPVVIIPLFTSLVVGLILLLALSRPLAWLTEKLTDGLNNMSGSYSVLLGVVLGLMMCFDLGGPVNKAAYLFAVTGLSTQTAANYEVMAAVMISGMVPPLALALACVLRPKLFTEPEIENGRAAWLLGAAFISEGAIPFAAADPFRVIPAVMAGGAVAGGLSELFGVQLLAPHGGIFVLFAVDGVLGFLVALVAGMVVAAALVVLLKGLRGEDYALEIAEGHLVDA
jgi:PTS system fructose-specific IIC component